MRSALLPAFLLLLAVPVACAARARQQAEVPEDEVQVEEPPEVGDLDEEEPALTPGEGDAAPAEVEPEPTARGEEGDRGVEPLSKLSGQWRFAGGSQQRSSVEQAIEEVVDDMNVFVRGIARSRLEDANRVPPEIAITPDGENLTVQIGEEVYTGPISGETVRVRNPEGGISRMRYKFRDGSLYQIFRADDGDRINVFTPRDDGDGVSMWVTMRSDRLPKDVKYRLSYR